MANGPRTGVWVLDDRSAPADGPVPWRFFTDAVMGGVSTGGAALERVEGRPAVCLQGVVRLDHGGGFVQIALDVPEVAVAVDPPWAAIEIDIQGNGRRYGVHLRTSDLVRPWQSYRASIDAAAEWRRVRLPFERFEPYRTEQPFAPGRLRRIGVLGIGERFEARVCVARVALVR